MVALLTRVAAKLQGVNMGCCESIMRAALGAGGGVGRGSKSEVEMGESTSSKPFTMHPSLRGPDVLVEGRRVSGTGLALGCAPVEQVGTYVASIIYSGPSCCCFLGVVFDFHAFKCAPFTWRR